jgi:hypothetical protein
MILIYVNARGGGGESTYKGGSAYRGGFGLGLGSSQYIPASSNDFGGSSNAGGGVETLLDRKAEICMLSQQELEQKHYLNAELTISCLEKRSIGSRDRKQQCY